MYSKTVMEHFKSPKNVGVIEDADGVGEIGNPLCGDMMTIYLKIEDDHIDDIKFQTFGCGAAIAVSSMLTEMAKGKSLEEARRITNKDVAEALEGLPKNKLHCSNLGADALQLAINNYEDRKWAKGRKNSNAKTNIFPPIRKRHAIAPIVILRSQKERQPARIVSWPFR